MLENNDYIRRSTGNKLGDFLLGGLVGGADSQQQLGYYVPMSNWQGNGLAKTGIQYLANPNYRDYASGARMFSSIFGNDINKLNLPNFNFLGRLSGLGDKFGNVFYNLKNNLQNNVGDFDYGFKRNNLMQDELSTFA